MVRGDGSYRETLSGSVEPDLSVVLIGRGALNSRPDQHWVSHLSGRFAAPGSAARFDASGQLMGQDGWPSATARSICSRRLAAERDFTRGPGPNR